MAVYTIIFDNKREFLKITNLYSIGGEDGEPAIEQDICTGEMGGTSTISGSTNHMALCGYMNIFSYGKNSCQIDNMP